VPETLRGSSRGTQSATETAKDHRKECHCAAHGRRPGWNAGYLTQARDRYSWFSREWLFFKKVRAFCNFSTGGPWRAYRRTLKPLRSWNENTYHSPPCFRTGSGSRFCRTAISSLQPLPAVASGPLRQTYSIVAVAASINRNRHDHALVDLVRP
jgi:hypothetical protein